MPLITGGVADMDSTFIVVALLMIGWIIVMTLGVAVWVWFFHSVFSGTPEHILNEKSDLEDFEK